MRKPLPLLLALALVGVLPTAKSWGQTGLFGQKKDTYRFDKSVNDLPAHLPKAVPGRVHLLDGTTRTVPLVYLDYNRIVAVEPGVKTAYTPLEVGSFVMKQDSFVVLRDFNVQKGSDEQEFRIAFVQVGAVGPDFTLYRFRGTMRHDDATQQRYGGTIYNGTTWTSVGGSTSQSTAYTKTEVWFLKRSADPRWLSLPKTGRGLTAIVEPIIADDKKLDRRTDWTFLTDDGVPELLNEYLANKKARPD